MRVVLHHRGAERVLERVPILDRDVLDRLHGVEVLGQRHRQPRVAELCDEASHQIEHRIRPGYLSTDSSFAALAMSVWYLSRMCSVSLACCGVDVVDAEQHERAGPVDRLGHRRRLLQVELADRAHDAGDLVGEVVGDVGHLGQHDLLLALQIGVVDVEVEAAALQRLGQLTGVVRREEHERDLLGRDRAELGDRHLVVGQDLEQQRLGLDLDAVDLVDQQHDRIVGRDRLEQRSGEQELVGEDVVVDLAPRVGRLVGLDAQELLLVVPLVERLGLVEALVALQADEPGPGHLGHGLGQLGLARAGRTLDEHRLAEPVGQEDHAGNAVVGEVVDVLQALADGLHVTRSALP